MEWKFVAAPAAFKSNCWAYFKFKSLKNDQGQWETDKTSVFCSECESKLKYSGNTTNMMTHLQRHHMPVFMSLRSKPRTDGKNVIQEAQASTSSVKTDPTQPSIKTMFSKKNEVRQFTC